MKPVILIPTYNESIAIVELLNKLTTLHNVRDFDVVVLDDNSPDKTADIVDSLNLSWVSKCSEAPWKSWLRSGISCWICSCSSDEQVFKDSHNGCRWFSSG